MSVAVVLPARLASSRLPGKLLLDRTGRTVLEHTLACALEAKKRSSGLITQVVAACDDAKLVAAAERAGVKAVMTRPDHPSGTDRIAEAAAPLSEDVIVNLQADEPELDPDLVVQVAVLLTGNAGNASMSTLAVPVFDEAKWLKPNVVKVVVDGQGRALYFSRAPIPHPREESSAAQAWSLGGRRVYGLHHLGLYAYRKDFLLGYKDLPPSRLEQLEKLEQLRALEAGHTIRVGLAKAHPPGIDTQEEYDAFVERWKKKNEASMGVDLHQYQTDFLDRGATYYGF
ncbi:MAG: 3-deoxy-manno-octulosonate cytidylyltransferase [Planctomycetota bacterium]|nr:3-deoxy-manno-octulosonate cytidylyltransferase [Planctomycetota bacterium]